MMIKLHKFGLSVILLCGFLLPIWSCGGGSDSSGNDQIAPHIPGSWNMSSAELLDHLNAQGLNAELDKTGGFDTVRFTRLKNAMTITYVYHYDGKALLSVGPIYETRFNSDSERQEFIAELENGIGNFLGKPDVISLESAVSLRKVMQKGSQVVVLSLDKNFRDFMTITIFYNPNNPYAKRIWPEFKAAGFTAE